MGIQLYSNAPRKDVSVFFFRHRTFFCGEAATCSGSPWRRTRSMSLPPGATLCSITPPRPSRSFPPRERLILAGSVLGPMTGLGTEKDSSDLDDTASLSL